MDVFSVFTEVPYTFLQIDRGTVVGDVIASETAASGVFKLRTGIESGQTEELRQSGVLGAATLHVHPEETFITANSGNLVGHGVEVDGVKYEIAGQTGGKNFDNGIMEHYRLSLTPNDFWSGQDGS